MFTITPEQNLFCNGVAISILLLCVFIIIIGIILIHELPYKIAKRREHPQQDAIRCMAILGLFLIPLWFASMIWAYMRGKTFGAPIKNANVNLTEIIIDDESILVDKEKLLSNIKRRMEPITRTKPEKIYPKQQKRPPRRRNANTASNVNSQNNTSQPTKNKE